MAARSQVIVIVRTTMSTCLSRTAGMRWLVGMARNWTLLAVYEPPKMFFAMAVTRSMSKPSRSPEELLGLRYPQR